ncbi:BRISC and BRCA1-A complex member 1 [Anabrus simplex]|uniref:BRISC and BRCA1-A complex member 1 n=1 Tax=Anabrus simplex TaxID=316456 RepID=UPI0034DD4F39
MENDNNCITIRETDDSEEDSENGVEAKSAHVSIHSSGTPNNVDISRSSSSASLVSSSQTDDIIRNNCYPADDFVSNDDAAEVVLEDVEKMISRNLPLVNVPEKIIICLDTAQDPDYTPFKLGDGSKYTPLSMIKRVTEIFMKSKHIINAKHEFALIVLQSDSALWLRDFTREPCEIVLALDDVSESCPQKSFDLSALFDLIKGHVLLPVIEDPSITPPPYVVRVILLYSRSYCLPEFKHGRESFDFLTASQYFTLDTLYIHEDPSENNKCEEIYKVLDDLDEKGFSYVFGVPRKPTILHDTMAKLLAHPLQRPLQKMAHYKLEWQEPQ